MDELNEKIEGLVKKAEKSKMPYSILKKVYDRGMAAWRTGHRPGTTPQQWAFARVNSFITKSSGTWGKADKDLAKQVRGEEVEKRTTAKEMIGQVKEKLPKDADAGDYVKDFRKSDAPQFKGKSDKKIQKMAIAAYLDDKDKKESIKENLLIHTKDDRVTDQLAYHLQDLQGRGRSNISDIDLDNVYNHHKNKYVKGRINVEIDGSRSDSQKLIKDLQKKYGSKIKVSLDMGEDNIQEEKGFKVDFGVGREKGMAVYRSKKDAEEFAKRQKRLGHKVKITPGNYKQFDEPREEKDLDEALKFKYAVVNTSNNNEVIAMSSDEKDMQDTMRRRKERSLKVVKLKRPVANDKMIGYPLKEEVEIQEQIKTLNTNSLTTSDQLKLAIHFDKLSKDRQVPPENQKAYTAVSDYLRTKTGKRDFDNVMKKTSAMHKQDIEIEMSRIIGKSKTKKVIESKENMQESGHTDVASMKTQVQIAKDALEKMNTELGKLSDEEDLPTWWTNKVATAVGKLDGMADYIDAKSDQGQKMNEDNITEERVFVVRFEKEGMRFAVPFSDMKRAKDGEKILKKSAGVSNVSVTKDILKPGVKFKRTQEGKIVAESKMGELFLDMQMDAQEMSERDFIKTYSRQGFQAAELKRMHKEFNEEVDLDEDIKGYKAHVGPRETLSYHLPKQKKSMKAFFDLVSKHPKVKNVKQEKLKPDNRNDRMIFRIDYDTDKNTQIALMKELDKLEKKFGEYTGQTNVVEEVDNSLMAQATRVISQTSIKEKIDPADIDMRATDSDRKAADKNIIIQLRRAQDMVKQTGRQDQTGVEFLDKKKQKIDSKIINKALDMFDKMKPNDKAKMQKTIGKSYRDLLKTVQRGRI